MRKTGVHPESPQKINRQPGLEHATDGRYQRDLERNTNEPCQHQHRRHQGDKLAEAEPVGHCKGEPGCGPDRRDTTLRRLQLQSDKPEQNIARYQTQKRDQLNAGRAQLGPGDDRHH